MENVENIEELVEIEPEFELSEAEKLSMTIAELDEVKEILRELQEENKKKILQDEQKQKQEILEKQLELMQRKKEITSNVNILLDSAKGLGDITIFAKYSGMANSVFQKITHVVNSLQVELQTIDNQIGKK